MVVTYGYVLFQREARCLPSIFYKRLILCEHYTTLTRDRLCLVYMLMTETSMNVRVVMVAKMKHSRRGSGRSFYFGSILEQLLYRDKSFEEPPNSYLSRVEPQINVTMENNLYDIQGVTMIIIECHTHDNNL